jgi:hypothetical protein
MTRWIYSEIWRSLLGSQVNAAGGKITNRKETYFHARKNIFHRGPPGAMGEIPVWWSWCENGVGGQIA